MGVPERLPGERGGRAIVYARWGEGGVVCLNMHIQIKRGWGVVRKAAGARGLEGMALV